MAMTCRACGHDNPESYTFCDACGEILVQSGPAQSRPGPKVWMLVLAALGIGGCIVVAVLLLGGEPKSSGGGASDDDARPAGCCKVCRVGKACGDSCIDEGEACHEDAGCACDGAPCCKVCRAGKACGDSCIDEDATCSVDDGCACNADD